MSRRLYEHKNIVIDGFTKKYHIDKLVYYEEYSTIKEAIIREKQLKGWTRAKKNVLILEHNPLMKDLSENRIE